MVVAQGAFAIEPGGAAHRIDPQPPIQIGNVHHGDPATSSVRREGALATFKPRTDVHLHAVARAPHGQPRTSWPVHVRVGALRKALTVRGPYVFAHVAGGWIATDPVAVAEVPLTWERAFGGSLEIAGARVTEPANPLGTGFIPPGTPTDRPIHGAQVVGLDEPPHRPGRRYTPEGVGPLAPDAEPRLRHAGTYDEAWQRERWPRLPDDFDFAFYNSAAPGLVADGYLRGDEPVELVNLTTAGALRFSLPGLAAPWVLVKHADRHYSRVEMRLDTVHIDVASPTPSEHRVHLTWRACAPMHDWARAETRWEGADG